MKSLSRQNLLLIGAVFWALFLAMPNAVHAHVKWFSEFSFLDRPLSFTEAINPLFIGLGIAAAITMTLTVFIDKKLEDFAVYQKLRDWLDERRDQSTLILRIGMGMTFLLSWQSDTLLAPYLEASPLIGWVQFVLVLLLIFPKTTPLAGLGTIILWLVGVMDYGTFYMLDYIGFVGIGTWLLLSQAKTETTRELGIPAMYFTVGFALAWLAMEKIIYPQWGLEILQENPQLALGFPFDFFATSAAFVEFTLGYLLIIGLLGRPLSLVITLVFFTTTLVFGKVEIIGHTHLHTALLVFLLHGPGRHYPAPIDIHQKLNWRMAFAAVNYVILLFGFLFLFSWGAQLTYNHEISEVVTDDHIATCTTDDSATIRVNNQDIPCEIVLEAVTDNIEEETDE